MRHLRLSKVLLRVIVPSLIATTAAVAITPQAAEALPTGQTAGTTVVRSLAGVSSSTVSRLENRAAVAPARKQAATAKTSKVVVRYTVKVNDTLSQIAADHRLNSWQPLAAANTDIVKNPNLIWPGQRLRVPSSSQGDQAPEAQMPPSRQTSPVRQQPSQTIRTPQVQQPQPATGNGDPQSIARELLASNGWSDQWSCLNSLVNRESGWNIYAQNPSGAYGIPQSLPGSKMASMGSDWRTSALTQLRWMMQYLRDVYGGPCGAWGHSQRSNWY